MPPRKARNLINEADGNDLIEEINPEILKKLSKSALSNNASKLDLCNPKVFQLRTLDGMKDMKTLDKLSDINISKNKLKKIDILSKFRSLTRINASENEILSVELDLRNLVELDLSSNKLQRIPVLKDLHSLEKLFLQNNLIDQVSDEIKPVKQNLELLDLTSNKINFISEVELNNFIKLLATMSSLKVLNLGQNPFMDNYPRIKDFFIRELCPGLEQINQQVIPQSSIDDIKKDNNFPKLAELMSLGNQMIGKKGGRSEYGEKISLDKMNNIIEACSSNPIKCMENITQLSVLINKLIIKPENWDEVFISKDPTFQSEKNDQMDNFLQNSLILIENQHTIQRTLMSVIANLSQIPHAQFGQKCLTTLNDLMSSGSEMKELVYDVLREVVVPFLNKETIAEVPTSVLEGLIDITNEDEDERGESIFTKETINYMCIWIKEILRESRNKHEDYDKEVRERHDHSLELIAAASKRNANIMRDFKISTEISELFKMTVTSDFDSRYISLLHIIENTSRADPSTGREYLKTREMKDSLFREIKDEITKFIQEFNKNKNDLRDEQAKDTEQIVKIKFMKFSSLISAYGSILHYNKFTTGELKNEVITKELLQITCLPKVNPVLLTSLCYYFIDLLNNEYIHCEPNMIKHIAEELQKLNPLLPYLGGKKYKALCEMGEMYQANTFYGKEGVSLSQLTNKVLHQLFIAIVKLISFFSENANLKKQITTVCNDVARSLNQNQRENFLFNCLVIPSDDVRLAIVKCLLMIKVEEWETEEIGHLVTMLGSYKNLGAGKTEQVLSSIFMILSKLCLDQQSRTGKDFASMFAENAIIDCLDILSRNMERNVRDNEEENKEKVDLALSCVFFLKTVSANNSIKDFLRGSQVLNCLRRSLIAEEKFIKENMAPIEIERTWAGKNIEYLLHCTTGNDAVDAYHFVSYRIISRIADVLQGKREDQLFNITLDYYEPDDLKLKTEAAFKQRINEEFGVWTELKSDVDEKTKEHFLKQHSLFSNQNGLDRVLMFLLGKTTSSKAAMLEKKLLKEFDEKYTRNLIKEEIKKKVQQFEKNEIVRQKEEEENKKKAKNLAEKIKSSTTGKDILEKAFQEQGIIGNFDEKLIDKFILNPPQSSKIKELTSKKAGKKEQAITEASIEFLIRDDSSEENQRKINLNKRALLVAAMLRCMYAAIEFAPDNEIRGHAIEQIRSKATIKMLTQLSASTGWNLANIGSKYLKIVYYGLKLSDRVSEEDEDKLDIYELVSKAVCDMLQLVRKRIMDEDKNPLTLEDKMLIYDLSRCASLICTQIPQFHWSNMDFKLSDHRQTGVVRSPQELSIEFLLGRLIPKNFLRVFIDIIISDMKASSTAGKESMREAKDLSIRENSREHIINILGAYLSKCKDTKYEILEQFPKLKMKEIVFVNVFNEKAEIFEKRNVRQSFVQDVLDETGKSNYLTALVMFFYFRRAKRSLRLKKENYLHKQKMLHSEHRERIVEFVWCQIREETSSEWSYKYYVLTSRSTYILKAPKKICSVCPPEYFCPEGPSLEHDFDYDRIRFVLDMEGDQRIAINVKMSEGSAQGMFSKKRDSMTFLIFFPKFNTKRSVLNVFDKYSSIKKIEDEISRKAVQISCKKNYSLCLWAILNPGTYTLLGGNLSDKTDDLYERKRLFVISDEKMFIFKENPEHWFFFYMEEIREKGDENDDDVKLTEKKIAKKDEKLKLDEAKKKAFEKYFVKVEDAYDLQSLKWFSFEQTSTPLLNLKFGNNKVAILFGCDAGREKLRTELMRAIPGDNWSKKAEEPKK